MSDTIIARVRNALSSGEMTRAALARGAVSRAQVRPPLRWLRSQAGAAALTTGTTRSGPAGVGPMKKARKRLKKLRK